MSRGALERWLKAHENNPYAQTPKAQEVVNNYRSFHYDYGMRAAASNLASANEANEANVKRTRDVAEALIALRDKVASDPLFSSKDAIAAREALLVEYKRLRSALPHLAESVERARAISADPIGYAEQRFSEFPAMADRIPKLPNF